MKNSILVDNGDLIQGNPIADYQSSKGSKEGRAEPSIMALNAMQYDAGTLGNHEFNYGLAYLDNAIKQAKFPIVNANIVKPGTDEPFSSLMIFKRKKSLTKRVWSKRSKSATLALYHRK